MQCIEGLCRFKPDCRAADFIMKALSLLILNTATSVATMRQKYAPHSELFFMVDASRCCESPHGVRAMIEANCRMAEGSF